MQPSYQRFARNVSALKSAGLPVSPPEDPPTRNLDGEVLDLMCGFDTEYLSYGAFADEAEETLFTMVPARSVVALYLAASRSKDPVMKGMAADAREQLEELARRLMGRAIDKKEKRQGVRR